MINRLIYSLFLLLYSLTAFSQIEFCSGDKGDPVFLETFSTSLRKVDETILENSAYKYVKNGQPMEGDYTISSRFDWFPMWFKAKDHTKNDIKGRALIINVSEHEKIPFFEKSISGLCSGTTYEFSTWLLNLNTNVNSPCTKVTSALGGIPVNVRFEIWDETNTNLLKSATTGQLFSEAKPVWRKYGTTFTTSVGEESVILKISNYALGGCGNDLAIDDIQFAACGDKVIMKTNTNASSPLKICSSELSNITLNCTSDFSLFKKHFYKWQSSSNGVDFQDVFQEKSNILKLSDTLSNGKHIYRVKVAESLGGLENPYCNSISEYFVLNVVSVPEIPVPDKIKDFCSGETVSVQVKAPAENTNIRWYDREIGGKLLGEGVVYKVGELASGTYTYYVESVLSDFNCMSSSRLPISIKVHEPLPTLKDNVTLVKCPSDEVVLDSEVVSVEYLWNTGETTKEINVIKEGLYSVTIHAKNNDFCKTTRTYNIINIKGPVIKKIKQEGNNLSVLLKETGGVYEYSINDGNTFKESATFSDIKNGRYVFIAKRVDSCYVNGPKFPFIMLNYKYKQ